MLRRTKAIISHQLPKKSMCFMNQWCSYSSSLLISYMHCCNIFVFYFLAELVVFCRLPSFQETIYKAILSHDAVKFILHRNKPCDCWSGKTRSDCCYKVKWLICRNYDSRCENKTAPLCNFNFIFFQKLNGLKVRSLILQMMHLLLKASNHTALLIPRQFSTSNLQQKLCKDVCETAFSQHSQFVGLPIQVAYRTLSDPQYCGKMEVYLNSKPDSLCQIYNYRHVK